MKHENVKLWNSRVVSGHDELAAHHIELVLALESSGDGGGLGGANSLQRRKR